MAFGSYPSGGPAWTSQGAPVPFSQAFGSTLNSDPTADIAVEDTNGPILLGCGGKDELWPSCTYAAAMMQRLAAHSFSHHRVLYRYPAAGHLMNLLVPYLPRPDYDEPGSFALDAANQAADDALWPRFLAFMPRPAD